MQEKLDSVKTALQSHVYETTNLCAREHDGSHKCEISADTLEASRKALTTLQELSAKLRERDEFTVLCSYIVEDEAMKLNQHLDYRYLPGRCEVEIRYKRLPTPPKKES